MSGVRIRRARPTWSLTGLVRAVREFPAVCPGVLPGGADAARRAIGLGAHGVLCGFSVCGDVPFH